MSFIWKKAPDRAAPHIISEWGCIKTLSLVGIVDGILTKPRNHINHDSLLIYRFRTSINHPLSLSLDNACILPWQREDIKLESKVSAACRKRPNWPTKQLTLAGDEDEPGIDFKLAKDMAMRVIGENFSNGISKTSDVAQEDHPHGEERQQRLQASGSRCKSEPLQPPFLAPTPKKQPWKPQHYSAKVNQQHLAALQTQHTNQMSSEGLPFTMQCNTIQHSIRYNTMSNYRTIQSNTLRQNSTMQYIQCNILEASQG